MAIKVPHVRVRSERMTEVMYSKGLTPMAFGKLVGISDNTIRRLIRNENKPNPSTVKKICEALGVEFNEIFLVVME